ncbi:MAG: purine-nucleoside phosphorylase [Mycoplasmataceae bacterium]|nr:purine-nucleoside phosphorylase [Mycoplasmataceae bacterium]
MTPHINAKKGEIAKTVLMPGDPLRAKFIAENYLQDVKLVNEIRNMFMYTGTYKGKPVTIAGGGMGCPSIGIYSYELFKFYDVDNIIRIGSAGSYKKEIKIYDLILATEAFSENSVFTELVLGVAKEVVLPSQTLNDKLIASAKKLGKKLELGRIHSSDVFYSSVPLEKRIERTQSLAVEMESYALFTNAEKLGKKAACILTVSDNLITNEESSAEERQNAFRDMMEVALEIL